MASVNLTDWVKAKRGCRAGLMLNRNHEKRVSTSHRTLEAVMKTTERKSPGSAAA